MQNNEDLEVESLSLDDSDLDTGIKTVLLPASNIYISVDILQITNQTLTTELMTNKI